MWFLPVYLNSNPESEAEHNVQKLYLLFPWSDYSQETAEIDLLVHETASRGLFLFGYFPS